jgi:POT family proton-dependent oligopeptide transporter
VPDPGKSAQPATWAGHPAGLRTLFFTEMWERFSYYGMRALLVLFMVDAVSTGGLGFDDQTATAIYGLYTAAVYLVTLPGGWIADRLIGAQRAIWLGGVIIMLGHFTLAIPSVYAFFAGLVLVALGTGMLKPNISAVVGALYPPGDPRRDAGFTIFYMGINVGGALGPFLCSTLGESDLFGWHYGFAAAGVGMFFGLLQFRRSRPLLGNAGLAPPSNPDDPADRARIRRSWIACGVGLAAIGGTTLMMMTGVLTVDTLSLARGTTVTIVLFAAVYFGYLFAFGGLSPDEKRRVSLIVVLFLASAMFWAGFEQAGSSLNLFAERFTDRVVGGFEIPAGWFQTLNPTFIILLAPAFAALWVQLARRNLDPSTPAKFALGLIILGLGFLVMFGAAERVVAGNQVLPTWLIFTYLFHTMGELALSPVGLSATTKLAPARYAGQMMGVWFLGGSLGNVIAGLIAGGFSAEAVDQMPAMYIQIVLTTAGTGLLLLVFSRPLRKLMAGVS